MIAATAIRIRFFKRCCFGSHGLVIPLRKVRGIEVIIVVLKMFFRHFTTLVYLFPAGI